MSSTHLIPKVVKLDPIMRDRLEGLGQIRRRSPHWLMQEAIAQYLDREEHEEQLKQETLSRWQEAEKGRVVSHEAVSAWLDTWGTNDEMGSPRCGS